MKNYFKSMPPPCFWKTLLERKKKWKVECQHRDEEVEELCKSSQQELDNLRAQLYKSRTSANNNASEQVAYRERAYQLYTYILCDIFIICNQSTA